MIAPLVLAAAVQAPAPKTVVTLETPEAVRIAPAGHAEARLVVKIEKGFKIQANPAANRFLVPARVELAADARVHAGKPKYPPGKPHRLPGDSSDLSVYEGKLVVRVPLEASAEPAGEAASSREVVLEGRFHYQACNERVCLRPSSIPVRVPVRIEPGARSGTR